MNSGIFQTLATLQYQILPQKNNAIPVTIDVCLMMRNATVNDISDMSWRSVLLVEEIGGPGENHRPVASH
jgi:hypothetical protein